MVGGLGNLQDAEDVSDGLALGNQLISLSLLRRSLQLELADDLSVFDAGQFSTG
jgi:hypothetical protein